MFQNKWTLRRKELEKYREETSYSSSTGVSLPRLKFLEKKDDYEDHSG